MRVTADGCGYCIHGGQQAAACAALICHRRQLKRSLLPATWSLLRDGQENILLTANRQLRLADFGLSINWQEERPVTRAGTLDYMSPEVLACPEKSRPEENKASSVGWAAGKLRKWASVHWS